MLLHGKTAVVFGAGGAIGSQVARVLAREGAGLFLSGRRLEPVEKVAGEIRAAGGTAEAARVDALDEKAVDAHLDTVVARAGKIDVVFNAMGLQPIEFDQGRSSLEVPFEKFLIPMNTQAASQFLTARAAARHMATRHSGVVVLLSATPGKGVAPWIAGISAAFAATEGLARCLATEWGPMGIRVVCVRSAGMPETRTIQQTMEAMARVAQVPTEALAEGYKEKTLLRRMATVAETAEVVAFLASDRAGTMTGAIANASCGEVLD